MALVAPRIMTTTTCVQLDQLPTEPTNFHRYIIPDEQPVSPKTSNSEEKTSKDESFDVRQNALLLKGAREQYTLVSDHSIPSIIHRGEILVKVSRNNL